MLEIFREEFEIEEALLNDWAKNAEKGIYDASLKGAEPGMVCDLNHSLSKKFPRKIPGEKKERTVTIFPFKKLYMYNFRKVSSNLTINPNRDSLLDRIEEEEVTPYDLGRMTHIELDPDNFQVQRVKELQADNENTSRIFKQGRGKGGVAIQIPYDIIEEMQDDGTFLKKEVEVPDSMLVCGKCGMRKTSSYEMQTRSADEPMTIFATCLCCGNRWRM
tara:strand:+ start:258 stop:911 length:654 start_codon:yes stop_codon:yes gene_type:complete